MVVEVACIRYTEREKKGKEGQVRLEVRCKVRGKKGFACDAAAVICAFDTQHITEKSGLFYHCGCCEGGYKLLDVKEGDGDSEGQRLF